MASLAVLAGVAGATLGELVSAEIRGRLDKVPFVLLRLAGHRLGHAVRGELLEEWGAELHEILRGAEALPVTRLLIGTRFALGLLAAGRRIERELTVTANPAREPSEDLPKAVKRAMRQRLVQPEAMRLAAFWLPTAAPMMPPSSDPMIGGDWYDAIHLAPGRTALVVGRATVNGATAAVGPVAPAAQVIMRLRQAARNTAPWELPPAQLLEHLCRTLGRLPAGSDATVVYCVHDAERGTITYANAGNPAPVLRLPDGGVALLDAAAGPSLGSGTANWPQASANAPADSFLAFYTCGLLQHGVNDLQALLAGDLGPIMARSGGGPVDLLRDHILETAGPKFGVADNVALMVAHVLPPEATGYSKPRTAPPR